MTNVIIDGVRYIPAPELDLTSDKSALDVVVKEHGTVRGFLHGLLSTLWEERDGFSGKRPFGNSGWQWDIFYPLAEAGFINFGEAYECDGRKEFEPSEQQIQAAHEYVASLIDQVFSTP